MSGVLGLVQRFHSRMCSDGTLHPRRRLEAPSFSVSASWSSTPITNGWKMVTMNSSARKYWLILSLVYGLSLSMIGLGQGIWVWVSSGAALVFITIHAYVNGQIVSGTNRGFPTATPGVGLLAMVGGAAAILLHNSTITYWAVPVLSAIGFAAMFWFLTKHGKFYQHNSDEHAAKP